MAEMAIANSSHLPVIQRSHEQAYDPRLRILTMVGTAGISTFDFFRNTFSGTNTFYVYVMPSDIKPEITHTTAGTLRLIKDGFKLSMVELAKIFNVSRQALYEWMDGSPLSNENLQKLDNLYSSLNILNDVEIQLSPQIIRRDINGAGSIIDAIKTNNDTSILAQQLKKILHVEANQRKELTQRFANRTLTSVDIHSYAAPSYSEIE